MTIITFRLIKLIIIRLKIILIQFSSLQLIILPAQTKSSAMKQLRLKQDRSSGHLMSMDREHSNYSESGDSFSEDDEAKEDPSRTQYVSTSIFGNKQGRLAKVGITKMSALEIEKYVQAYQAKAPWARTHYPVLDPKKACPSIKVGSVVASHYTVEQIREISEQAKHLYLRLHKMPNQSDPLLDIWNLKFLKNLSAKHKHAEAASRIQSSSITFDNPQPCLPKRIQKRISKEQDLIQRSLKLQLEALRLYNEQNLTQIQISKRLKMPFGQVQKITSWSGQKNQKETIPKMRRLRFKALQGRPKTQILEYLSSTTDRVQASDIKKVLESKGFPKVSQPTIHKFLRDECGMTYRKVLPVLAPNNSPANLLARQFAAGNYIQRLHEGTRLINIDESVLRSTDNRSRCWQPSGVSNKLSHSQRMAQLNVIGAVSNLGEVRMSLNKGRTNSLTFLFFLTKLCETLDTENKGWRDNTILMLDNASYHRSSLVRDFIDKQRIQILFLGPYQFQMAPVENLFSFLKNRDLNPMRTRTTRREHFELFLAQLAACFSQLDYSWIKRSFAHSLIGALLSLSLRPLASKTD